MKIQMLITEWKMRNFSIISQNRIDGFENRLSLKVDQSYDYGDRDFGELFVLDISDADYVIHAEAIYKFRIIDGVIDEEFKKSSFPKINAPAIAFPYLRAAIANMTLQAGLPPLMLPSFNFNKLAEDKAKSENRN